MLTLLFKIATLRPNSRVDTREPRAFREALGLPDVYKDYANLAEIVRARGDAAAAADFLPETIGFRRSL